MCAAMNIYTVSTFPWVFFLSHDEFKWIHTFDPPNVSSRFSLIHNLKFLRSGSVATFLTFLGGICHFVMNRMAWWISSLTFAVSLVTDAFLSHPSSRRPIWEHLCWPFGLTDLAVPVWTHGQNCCAGWGQSVSMSSNCLGPHVLSTWGEHTRTHPG